MATTEDALLRVITAAQDFGHPAPSGYLLAYEMGTVHSSLRPTLERMEADGLIVPVLADLPAGVEEMPGDVRWAPAAKVRS
jgi:hypothetical protein